MSVSVRVGNRNGGVGREEGGRGGKMKMRIASWSPPPPSPIPPHSSTHNVRKNVYGLKGGGDIMFSMGYGKANGNGNGNGNNVYSNISKDSRVHHVVNKHRSPSPSRISSDHDVYHGDTKSEDIHSVGWKNGRVVCANVERDVEKGRQKLSLWLSLSPSSRGKRNLESSVHHQQQQQPIL